MCAHVAYNAGRGETRLDVFAQVVLGCSGPRPYAASTFRSIPGVHLVQFG